MNKILEVVVCDLCKSDRPAVSHREIDVCTMHDAKLDERQAEGSHRCPDCGRPFDTEGGMKHHRTVSHG